MLSKNIGIAIKKVTLKELLVSFRVFESHFCFISYKSLIFAGITAILNEII